MEGYGRRFGDMGICTEAVLFILNWGPKHAEDREQEEYILVENFSEPILTSGRICTRVNKIAKVSRITLLFWYVLGPPKNI